MDKCICQCYEPKVSKTQDISDLASSVDNKVAPGYMIVQASVVLEMTFGSDNVTKFVIA